MNDLSSGKIIGIIVVGLIIVVLGLVAMGPAVKNMFASAVDSGPGDEAMAGLSCLLYDGAGSASAGWSAPPRPPAPRRAPRSSWFASRGTEPEAVPAATMRRGVAAGGFHPDPTGNPDAEYEPNPDGAPTRTEYHGSACLEVDDARDAGRQVAELVKELEGAVLASRISQGARNSGVEMKMRLRIPAAHFEEFVAAIHELGAIVTEDIQSQDRTRDYHDLAAAIDERQQAITEVETRIDERTTAAELAPLMRARRQLQDQREELETRQRRLGLRTDATIFTLTLREVAGTGSAVIPGGVRGRLGGAFATALDYGSIGFSYIVIGVGAALPWGIVAAAIWYVVRRRTTTGPGPGEHE